MTAQVYVIMELRYRENSMSLDRDDVLYTHQVFADPADAQAVASAENHREVNRLFDNHERLIESRIKWNANVEIANHLMREHKVGVPPHKEQPVPERRSFQSFLDEASTREGWLYVEPWDLVPSSNQAI